VLPAIQEAGVDLVPGRRVQLNRDAATIGRGSRCEVCIPMPFISREHCRLERRDDGWYISDLKSRNGTIVNGTKIETHRLADGDTIQILEYRFSFAVPAQEREPSAA